MMPIYPDLKNQIVFITGAASGIGLAMAHAFASNQCRLALLDIDPVALETAVQSLQQANPGLQVVALNAAVNDEQAVDAAFDQVLKSWGRIDVLLNNAGISMNCPTLELPSDQWRKAMDINVNGVFYCAQRAGRIMVDQGSGVILNMSSMYGTVAAPERAAYCTSKAAVAMLTKVLAIEWGAQGVRVNAIAPGYVRTALVDDLVSKGRMDLDALVHRTPSRRLGTTDDIAALALFMASAGASFMNGHVAVSDGGWSAYSYI